MSDFNLNNKTAIVTGGGSGIGLAISKLFARKGARVYIFEMNAEQAQWTAKEIQAEGGDATAVSCDVSDQEQVKQQVAAILDRQPVDILVNNAGIAHVGNLEGTSEGDFDRIFRVNVKGVYNCMHALIGSMKANGGGVILNMASVAASVGIPDRFAYSMSKGAVLTMTYSVAKDYVRDGIRCNCISPGRVHTPFVDGFLAKNYPGREKEMFEQLAKTQPIGRMASPEEIAALALFLCSAEAGFITGCDYPIDGGFIKLNT
ncbi:NAD(P)-dependent dehydrogenase (short-subunit alcohol dehydrogenase family) [Anseongella ginsenosidimutans]|uniref:NAD(P)-dependent dehydrogenase (Short-subunit alcohol dehydrogenase family) n=1 Tax=Anseongella ginsenosidimutans TaxID=496056 RepID=A0A4R3KWF0_9SPHI|nr:glucose 1-dehydrogenase [Anseongella ginsenosidimutans]QEC51225.1 glucose 1-dehydrogenase [Anseongella ginsenosidimutans]TCS90099.1 NAD(P)-dependent dehydrogenase (short-subunit alcohol dehydrogenase family) [Anseongella ginsenosidimutans]